MIKLGDNDKTDKNRKGAKTFSRHCVSVDQQTNWLPTHFVDTNIVV